MTKLTHILFDFFGTLVAYSPDHIGEGYARSYQLLVEQGVDLTYEAFVTAWDSLFQEFERQGQATLTEFSMTDLCHHFWQHTLGQQTLGRPVDTAVVTTFRDIYLAEWSRGVRQIPGVKEMLAALAKQYALVLVSNTHHAHLVYDHLQQGGIDAYFQQVVTSVAVGRCKPSPQIFAHALQLTGAGPETAVYVGDSYQADYLGASNAGLRCLLLDPRRQHDIPETHRLNNILDLPAALDFVR
jgi:putative hydrolase of the HAD superfamily